GLAILVLQVPIKAAGFALLSAAPEVKAAGQAFFNASIWGAPATLLNYVLIGWYLGRSQSGKVFLLSAIVNLSNVGLAYLFIVRWGWESAGAGAATALSRTLMAVIGIGLACREIDIAQVRRLSGQILNPKALKKSVALNSELMVRTFAMISVFAAFTNIGSTLGATVLSSNAVLLQAIALASYFIDGLAFATESVVGTLSAQGRMRSLIQLLKAAGSTSFLLGLMFALIFIAAPGPIFQLLTNHRDVLSHIDTYTPWLLPVLGFGSIAYFLDGYFIGLTEGRLLRVSALAAASIGFAPVALVAWYLHNNHVLWLGLALFMAIRAITLGIQVPKTLQKASGIQGQPLKAWE
ncbi:MAG TPA: MATE family efflux transporter, partial [Stenomitos sp.]